MSEELEMDPVSPINTKVEEQAVVQKERTFLTKRGYAVIKSEFNSKRVDSVKQKMSVTPF